MGKLDLLNLSVSYDKGVVADNISLSIGDGEIASLLGPSGSGKTTILKAVAGIINESGGDILINGVSVRGIPAEKRDAVMVFQKPLLFPFMNVEQNISFGLKMKKRMSSEDKKYVNEMIEMTQLGGLNKRKVFQLSGGQQQRVSLARALVLKPDVLLLDEPLSNLDASLRQEMRDLICDLQKETNTTTLFVTHDQSEALMMSDRVALLMEGKIRQVGTPHELFAQPIDTEVARFFGGSNFIEGNIKNGQLITCFGNFNSNGSNRNGGQVNFTIRPEDLEFLKGDSNGLSGVVKNVKFEGSLSRITVTVEGKDDFLILTKRRGIKEGDKGAVVIPENKIHVFD